VTTDNPPVTISGIEADASLTRDAITRVMMIDEMVAMMEEQEREEEGEGREEEEEGHACPHD